MLQGIARRIGALLIAVGVAAPLGLLATTTLAQEAPAAAETPKKEAKKPRGRLPLYFAKVVTSEQREKIYGIQATYQEQMDALMEQLSALEQKRDAEVQAVLTPEQQKRVADMLEEA